MERKVANSDVITLTEKQREKLAPLYKELAKELKIIDGQFSEALDAYIKATVEFRKEFFDLTKHRTIASTLMNISDYEWTSLAKGD